jgi:DNA polymerase-3 subunit alpha
VDKFRKAVGKKIPELMAEQREKFVHGCMEHSGWSEAKASEVWAWLEPFAAYGFNKAHSASYGRVAYQTAYLKANYPTEYMTAVLSAESGNMDTLTAVMNECKRMKIPVLGPDINESFGDFTAVKKDGGDQIRFGLYSIKNLGQEIADAIVAERKARGPFTGIANFLERIKHRNLNRKSLEALARAGALESLNEERGCLLYNLDNLIAYHQDLVKSGESQSSLFGLMSDKSSVPQLKLKECEPASQKEKLAWEKELLGLYVSGHPLDVHRAKFENNQNTIQKIKESPEGITATAGGILEEIKPIQTKKGDYMAFGKLADYTGSIELVFFSKIYADSKTLIQPETCVAVRGRMSHRNGEPSIVVDAIKTL